jgi:hypothetical protein
MPLDAGLLAARASIDPADEARVARARTLAERGYVTLTSRPYVRCVNAADRDLIDAPDRACAGRVYLAPDRDEDDGDYRCDRCDRVLYPSTKQVHHTIEASPVHAALRAFLHARLEALGLPVREHPVGLFRLETRRGEVRVYLADAFTGAFASEGDPALVVMADDVRLPHRLPKGLRTLPLAPLLLDSPVPLEHAVLALAAGVSPPPAAAVIDAAATFTRPAIAAARFPLPPAASWRDVTIYAVDGATIGIAAPGFEPRHHCAADLGMIHAITRNPTKRFSLLVHLCLERGRTDWRSAGFDNFEAFKMQAHGLRGQLRELFGTRADPFTTFGRHRELAAAFRALPDAPGAVFFVPRRRSA